MNERIRRVVVLGGGTAGWMAATYLRKALGEQVAVTVLEAPGIPRIGVGEATVPNLQKVFFDFLGIRELDWMRECNASFKMAVKFVNWRTAGPDTTETRRLPDGGPDAFYHPFGILPAVDNLPMSHYWLERELAGVAGERYDYACFVEPWLMDRNLAPHRSDGTPAVAYAWHFDAQLLADFLQRYGTEQLGVQHRLDRMVGADRDSRGFITALRTESGVSVEGDLFVDCSGFRGALINQVMSEPFFDQHDYLLCDRAVARQVPHDDERAGIEPYTSSIAMESGWAWKTPLLGRFGTGYVYSSDFVDDDQARLDFCRVWGLDPEAGPFNQIRFRVGRNRRSWVNNCVSIGLASCFLEPLESSGLYFTYAAIYQLAKHFPTMAFEPALVQAFNEEVAAMFDETRDFLQAHFYYSPRTDTEFWRANKELRLSADIQDKVAKYLAGLPVNLPITDESTYYGNFDAEFRNFWTNGSYYAILSGLGVNPAQPLPALQYRSDVRDRSEPMFQQMRKRRAQLLAELPTTYEYLNRLHRRPERVH